MKLLILTLVLLVAGIGPAHASETIYVANHAGSPWPVTREIRHWNQNGEIRLVQVASCTGRAHCADVWAEPYTEGVGGIVAYLYTANPQVILNTRTLYLGWWYTHETTCHELGHVLGLGHHRGDSCMNATEHGNHPWPTAGDLTRVR